MKIKCEWTGCIYNAAREIDEIGLCTADEVYLSDSEDEEIYLICQNFKSKFEVLNN